MWILSVYCNPKEYARPLIVFRQISSVVDQEVSLLYLRHVRRYISTYTSGVYLEFWP